MPDQPTDQLVTGSVSPQPTPTAPQPASVVAPTLEDAIAPTQAPAPAPGLESESAPEVQAEPSVPSDESETSDDADLTEEAPFEDEDPLANETIIWQASEYVHHHKGAGWYAVLGLALLLLLAIAVIFKLWLSIGVFVAMGAAIAVYAYKPPRVLNYRLDPQGVTIEGKDYPFETFRSFGVLSDASWHTIDLEPAKRFMPRLNILFSDEDFDSIVAHLEAHLPRADRQPDMVERVTRYLRF